MDVNEGYHLAPPDSYACMFIELLNAYMFIKYHISQGLAPNFITGLDKQFFFIVKL